MAAFSNNSFSTSSFSVLGFDFGAIATEISDYIIKFRRRRR